MLNISKEMLWILLIITCISLNFVSYKKQYTVIYNKENYDNEKPNSNNPIIVLLGDSIIDNINYTNDSVENSLNKLNDKLNILFLAKDNSKISNIYEQLKNKKIINIKNTNIFLSVGGNNLLTMKEKNDDNVNLVFNEYKKLITYIQSNYSNVNIHLFNLYYPSNFLMKTYYPIIDKWNLLLEDFIEKQQQNKKLNLIEINQHCYLSDDFVNIIEPSGICSNKLASLIILHTVPQPTLD
jgi:lysophospholipase L1-like esterase